MKNVSTRFIVLELLDRMDKKAYSNLVLDAGIKDLSQRDKAFVSKIFYGVLERKITLEYIISQYSSRPINKLDCSVLNILKMGIYQLLYMDSVPDSAAVNESVNLAAGCGKKSASGFVNAVLRNFIRNGKKFDLPKDIIERLSVEYSCGKDLTELLCRDYSIEKTEKFLANSLTPHKLYVRANTLKTTSDELAEMFEKTGIKAEICKTVKDCISPENIGGIEELDLFRKGMFHVQDLSSQLCCKVLSPKKGDTVLDVCAAPGGKSFTIAEIMENNGRVISCDLHKNRVGLIEKGAERLGISIIEPMCNDSSVHNEILPKADKILCDVPCSGFGVIRSKPEIKYTDIKDIERLPEVQYKILKTSASYLKEGGELVYSTCTLDKAENDRVIERFLEENNDFEPMPVDVSGKNDFKLTIFPEDLDCEGFFISKIRKVGR